MLVQGTDHIQVIANNTNVSAISLLSTGGLIGTLSKQTPATFAIDSLPLGAGLHPFYALVQPDDGRSYRTAVTWARLVGGQ